MTNQDMLGENEEGKKKNVDNCFKTFAETFSLTFVQHRKVFL